MIILEIIIRRSLFNNNIIFILPFPRQFREIPPKKQNFDCYNNFLHHVILFSLSLTIIVEQLELFQSTTTNFRFYFQ